MSRPRVYSSLKQSASGRFLDPKALARISRLDLLARTLVEGFISGPHRSPYLGRSLDFAEHRPYMPGDDIRKIDWRVFARTDRYYVKQFDADTNTNCTIALDISKSMDFGLTGISKFDYGRYLAACLAYFSHKQRDRVGLVTFDREIVDFVPPSAKHLELVLQTIERTTCSRDGSLWGPVESVAGSIKRKSIVILISDFYEDPDRIVAAMGLLKGKSNDVLVFHLLDEAEIDLPFTEAAEFVDLESGERLPVVPQAARSEYRERIEAHISELRAKLTEGGIDYAFFNTSTPLDFALFSYLSNRKKAARVR